MGKRVVRKKVYILGGWSGGLYGASQDGSWVVQEVLAKAFNMYCKEIGYEKALPMIKSWLEDGNPNVRRAASEGLRVWSQKDYFKSDPEAAIRLLSKLKDDESKYVRKSIGNSLRDISRKESDLVRTELAKWDRSNPRIAFTYGFALKRGGAARVRLEGKAKF
jgi:3-methyladenine DNA glycosylase AlkD